MSENLQTPEKVEIEQPIITPTADNQEPEAEKPDVAPDLSSVQSEVERLKQEREKQEKRLKDAKERADYWADQHRQNRAKFFKEKDRPPVDEPETKPVSPSAGRDPGLAPVIENFDTIAEYNKAQSEWLEKKIKSEIERKEHEFAKEQARRAADESKAEKTERIRHAFDDAVTSGIVPKDEFLEMFKPESTIPWTPMVAELLLDVDRPAELLYHLGTNISKLMELNRMSPAAAAREMAKIELSFPAQKVSDQNKPKISNAPPPIKPVGGGSAPITKDPNKMSQREYEEWRRGKRS